MGGGAAAAADAEVLNTDDLEDGMTDFPEQAGGNSVCCKPGKMDRMQKALATPSPTVPAGSGARSCGMLPMAPAAQATLLRSSLKCCILQAVVYIKMTCTSAQSLAAHTHAFILKPVSRGEALMLSMARAVPQSVTCPGSAGMEAKGKRHAAQPVSKGGRRGKAANGKRRAAPPASKGRRRGKAANGNAGQQAAVKSDTGGVAPPGSTKAQGSHCGCSCRGGQPHPCQHHRSKTDDR